MGIVSHPVTRYLYLARHGEASPDETSLTATGRRQATLLGDRLLEVPLSVIHHSPLPRAAQTAQLISSRLDAVPLNSSALAGDYVPYLPSRGELPTDTADATLEFLAQFPPADGCLAGAAVAEFTGPVDEPRHELVVTHNFLIAWLVRDAMAKPAWHWTTLNYGNAALTVICYTADKTPSILTHNDTTHLGALGAQD